MWEAITPASHGGKSIRRIFIFALVTIVMSFLCLFTFTEPTSAIADRFQATSQTTDAQDAVIKENAAKTAEADSEKPESSCAIDGIGWMVCPITKFLASGMDYIYGIVCTFLTVRPVSSDQNNTLFYAWSYMRSFANIAFVIAFLMIIYSQMTNFGLNNYGIKKLLPRLIIAAILVNVSYYICAVAIDLSNILGYSFNQVFISMREGLLDPSNKSLTEVPSWQALTALVLSGGAIGAGALGAVATYGVVGAAFLLVPALMTCLIAVLVALVVLAARQALITILVVIAPLAFVAYLLPNTEKLFEKWKSTFLTLLIIFPAFSIIFGGSQLASLAIIQNADSIGVVILGLLVQVAPLMITPLLIKLSGSILGKIGGIVNDPTKGLVDRANNYAKSKSEYGAAKQLGKAAGKNPFRKYAQNRDYRARKQEYEKKRYGDMAESRFANKYNNNLLGRDSDGKVLKGDRKLKKASKDMMVELESRTMASMTNALKLEMDVEFEALNGKIKPAYKMSKSVDKKLSELMIKTQKATEDIAIAGLAIESAKRVKQENLEILLAPDPKGSKDIPLSDYATRAAGIDVERGRGVSRTQAYARASQDKRQADEISARMIAMDSVTIPSERINDAAMFLKKAIKSGKDDDVVDARAAMKMLMTSGAPGKNKLHEIINDLTKAGDKTPVVVSMKNGLLADGIKSADITLDRWATNKKDHISLADIALDIESYKGLTPEDYAGQTVQVLDNAFEAHAITKDVASAILSSQAASKLGTLQREWLVDISNGIDPGKLEFKVPKQS